MSEQAVAAIPVTKCGTCRQTDDHPKHQIFIGVGRYQDGTKTFHEHDFDQNGQVFYHFDCEPPEDEDGLTWHTKVHPEYHAKLAALASSGVKGDELRSRIVRGDV